MPTSDAQRAAADLIASAYAEQVHITPCLGPRSDRTVVACPGGRLVVLAPDGHVIADSQRDTPNDRMCIHSLRGESPPSPAPVADGYDPAVDVLVVETCDDEWVLVPPWRCAMSAREHLPLAAVEARLRELRAWHANVIGEGSLRVWELRRGKTGLKRNA